MKTVNIQQAKTHLSRLVDEAGAGEEIIIAKAGKPLVKLVPVASLEGPRRLGRLAGKVRESRDCWDRDPDIEAMFYDGAVVPDRTSHPAPRRSKVKRSNK